MRKLGIGIIEEAPWGIHLCQFYQTREDLIDILVPYFKAGLEDNEFCTWITSEPLKVEDAKSALRKTVTNLDDYLEKGQIEILDYSQWYTDSGKFEADRVSRGWIEKENQALKKGFDGLRLTGNTFWLEQEEWEDFTEYEANIDKVIGKHRMIAICSYSLSKCNTSEVLDVVKNHEYALIRQCGKWELIENAGRRRAEKALHEKQKQMAGILESISDGFFALNDQFTITYFNKAAGELFGRKGEDVVGRNFFEAFPETRGSIFEEKYIQALKDKKAVVFESYFEPYKNWYDMRVYPGEQGISIYFQETTNRKKAEEELKKYRSHLEELVEERSRQLVAANEQLQKEMAERKKVEEELDRFFTLSLDMLCIASLDGYFKMVNPAFERVLGYMSAELFENPFLHFIHPEDQSATVVELAKLADGSPANNFENRYRCKDGTYKWFSWTAFPVPEEGIMYAVGRDISENKRAEETLRRSEEMLRQVFDQAPIGAATISLDYHFMRANKEFCRITGYSELTSLGILDITHPDDLEASIEKITSLATGKIGQYTLEKRYIRKDGETVWMRISVGLLKDSLGQPLYFLSMAEDITERKKMEEEIQKLEKFRSLSTLAGGIAHDFNNILTALIGNLSLVLISVDQKSKVFQLLSKIEKSSHQARDLTRQLLTFARGGAPVKKFAPIGELIKETASFMLRGSKAGCEFSLSDTLWPVEINEGQISQVINNLVLNAAQAMPQGGLIKICAENVTIGALTDLPVPSGKYIKISVEDQGAGMPEEQLNHIFDPYFTTKEEGNGLGLATTYSIIKRHDGYITVDSGVGVGTKFDIYLPASEKELFEVKGMEEESLCFGEGRILVMDDQEGVRNIAGEMLTFLGYEVEFVNDGEEAVEAYKRARDIGRPFDAVTLDLTIPGGMGGLEAVERLREADPDVRAIVSSGYTGDSIMSDYKRYGFSGVIAKPYEVKELSEVLYRVVVIQDHTR